MPLPLPVTGRLWAGRSRRPPAGRAGKGKGCAEPGPPSPPAPPHPAGGSRSGFLAPPAPGANSVAVRTPWIQTSILCAVHGEAGCRGRRARPGTHRSLHLPARPAPRQRTCDRCAGAPHTPASRGAPAPPLGPRRPGARPPRPRGPSRTPAPRQAGPRPFPARTHIAPQLLLGGRFPQPAGAHHVAAAAHAAGAWSPPRGRWTRARARVTGAGGGRCAARGAGRGRGGRGCGARTRRQTGGRARALAPGAHSRSAPEGAPQQEGGARSPRPQPAAPPAAALGDTNTAGRLGPRGRGARGRRSLPPAAPPPRFALFPKPPAARGGGGRAPEGARVGLGEGAAPLVANRFCTGGSSGRDPRAAGVSHPRVSGLSGSGSAEMSDPLPSKSWFHSHPRRERKEGNRPLGAGAFVVRVCTIVLTGLRTGRAALVPFHEQLQVQRQCSAGSGF